jgi:hypothetical protein
MPSGVYERTDEHKRKIGISVKQRLKNKENHPMYGKQHSLEAKKKMSDHSLVKGNHLSVKHKVAISNARKGYIVPNSVKLKISRTLCTKYKTGEIVPARPMLGKHHSDETKQEISKRCSVSIKNQYDNGRVGSMVGKHHSEETKRKLRASNIGQKRNFQAKQKMRISAIQRIERCRFDGNQLIPAYNSNACKIIDEYGKKHGYNFQHAENGGEFHIKDLGYFVDGYDKEKNTVIEIDEKRHFNENGLLKQKDVERQIEIENFLGCDFIRLKSE